VTDQDFNKFMFENYFYSENPPEFKRDAWYGLIFRWYGVDKIGNIAIFETGELPVPKHIFENEDNYREIDLFFRNLPKITTASLAVQLTGLKTVTGNSVDFSDAISDANKGLFFIHEMDTYVGKEYLYGYYLLAIPIQKIAFNTLPLRIQELLEPCRLSVIFSEISNIKVENYLECC
jgi:hypothetical protein